MASDFGTVHQKLALHLHLEGLLASLATKTMPTQMIKTDRMTVEHSGSVDAGGGGPTADKRLAHITLKQNAAEDRAYIESCFGRSLYPPERLRKAEQELCTGDHLGCHLWFASGVPSPEQAPTPEAKHLAEQAELQADRNRAYDAKNRELHRSVVLRLTEQIQNCILVHQQPNARIARSGNLDPERSMEIMTLLVKINQLGTTVLVVTHEKDLVNKFGKRVITIDQGRIINDSVGGYVGGHIHE